MMSRLQAEPGVRAVTLSSHVPGFAGGARIRFEDGAAVSGRAPWDVSRLDVAPDMLDVYGAEVLAGRRFAAGDLGAANAVIVNQTFARWLFGDVTAPGTRFRYLERAGQAVETVDWYEIVGLVRDVPRLPSILNLDTPAVVYHPAAAGSLNPAVLSVRFSGNVPAGFTDRARQIGAEVGPALQLRRVVSLSEHYDQLRSLRRYVSWGIALVTLSVLPLSAAGLYASMSFTVAERTREIGIRVALGARPRRLLASVFRRALHQLVLGMSAGALVSGVLISTAGLSPALATGLLLAAAATMLTVGLLAAFGPARRILRVDAAEA